MASASMPAPPSWENPKALPAVRAAEIERGTAVFEHGGYLYTSLGEQLGQGGMGTAFAMQRRPVGNPDAVEAMVGKVFHDEYLYQLRTDSVTRIDHQSVLENIHRIAKLGHPHLLPTLVSETIADNHLTVTPRKADTLNALIAQEQLSPRHRVQLFVQALRGVCAMHAGGFIHRDVTLRNILVDELHKNAYLFDFDLTLSLAAARGTSYKERYQGRIFGSPGYSVAPEILDSALMELEISHALDVYAVGSALFNLFTDELPYGPTEDMWGLLLRVSEGIVMGRDSRVLYPDSVPKAVRPIIEGCLERNPRDRYSAVDLVIDELTSILGQLPDNRGAERKPPTTLRYGLPKGQRVKSVVERRRDASVSPKLIQQIDGALAAHGYEIQRSLGRVKHHPIFLAAPIPELVAIGRFPDANTYPKIVTAVDLREVRDPDKLVDLWLGGYLPILRDARQGLLTSLYRVVHDENSQYLFLFSEYVDDARFGSNLDEQDLTLQEALGLGYVVARQVERLHSRGMAHNNIDPRSLLLKGLRLSRSVRPAMVGLVDPTLNSQDMANDVSQLAHMVAGWIRQARVESADETARARLVELWTDLKAMTDPEKNTAKVTDLRELLADGLSAVDYNFGVLRENDGDVTGYVLLLISTRLFGRLWE